MRSTWLGLRVLAVLTPLFLTANSTAARNVQTNPDIRALIARLGAHATPDLVALLADPDLLPPTAPSDL